jgi:hypothetical protein
LPVAISVLQSTGWQAPPKEVCSVDGNLTASATTVLFESLPIGVPLFLSITGSVKLADGKSDALISGLEGYLGGNATLHVEAIRSNNINNRNMPPQQRQGWNDGTRRMERQYSIDRHQQSHNQARNVTSGSDLVIISNSLSTLERKVKDAQTLQCELKDEMKKVLFGLKNAKSRSSGDPNEYVSLEQRISKLSKSSIFNNDLMQELSNTDYKKNAESSNNNNKYNNTNSSSNSSINNNNRNSNRMNDVNQNNLDPFKLADGKSDALISGLEGYLGGNATLHVEAIRSNNINNRNMPPQQRQGWNDGTRRMERQYSIDRHQQSHNQARNVTSGSDLVIISNSLSTLERKVKDAQTLQCELKDEMKKVLFGLKNAKSRSSGDPNEYVSLEQRISKLSKSSIFNNDLMQELSNTDYKKNAESSNNNNKYNNTNSSSNSSINNNNRNSNRMNDVNQNNLDPYKLDRKMSVQSRQRIMKLDDINNRVGVCKSEFNGLMDTLRISNNHTDKMKIKDALSQLYGNLEKLQFVEIDSVVVGDLQSGQKEAREVRKRLTKQVTNLLNEVKDAVKQLQA